MSKAGNGDQGHCWDQGRDGPRTLNQGSRDNQGCAIRDNPGIRDQPRTNPINQGRTRDGPETQSGTIYKKMQKIQRLIKNNIYNMENNLEVIETIFDENS